MIKFKKKLLVLLVIMAGTLNLSANALASNRYGIVYDYDNGVFFTKKNIIEDPSLVNGLSPLLIQNKVVATPVENNGVKWESGYYITGDHCKPFRYFRITKSGIGPSKNVKYTITSKDHPYIADVAIRRVVTENMASDTTYAVGFNPGSSMITVGWQAYSDSKCTKLKSGIDRASIGDDNDDKVYLELLIKLYRKGDNGEKIAFTSNEIYFGITDVDAAQSYMILNSNGFVSGQNGNMYTKSVNDLQPPGASNRLRNRFVKATSKRKAYVFAGYSNGEGNSDTVNTSNIYVKLDQTLQTDGINIVFGFAGKAGSGVEYYMPKDSYVGSIKVGNKQVGLRDTSADGGTYFINNCDPVNGCQVTFEHNLVRNKGDKETIYQISRTSNYDEGGVGDNSNLASGTTKNGKMPYREDGLYLDGPLTLFPGQTVCEKLSFKPSSLDNKTATLKLCASALGNAQPPDPSFPDNPGDDTESEAFIDMRVKNNDGLKKYQNFQKLVYGKPGDKLTYRATYNPNLQYAYYIDGLKSKISNWNNAFAVFSSLGNGPLSGFNANFYSDNFQYELGSRTKRRESNDYTVSTKAAGGDLIETAKTNHNDTVRNTPGQITFKNSNGENIGTIDLTPRLSSAHALIPYNFINEIGEPDVPDDEVIYSGEDNPIKYPIIVTPKTNEETSPDEEYATVVRDAKIKIIVYIPTSDETDEGTDNYVGDNICAHYGRSVGDDCKYVVEKNQDLNPNGLLDGAKTQVQATIREDRPAGTRICVAAAVYPSNSGEPTNLDPKGNDRWRISKSSCYVVAKKPTFQVWGGNLYSIGQINTLSTTKTINDEKIVFSSWVERDVTANGLVKALASGAATGLANNAAGGGSKESRPNFCDYRTPLSLANNGNRILPICPNAQQTGLSGISADMIDVEKLLNGLPVNLGSATTTDSLAINDEVWVNNGQTYVARTNGNITINANIIYSQTDNVSLTNLDNVPKAFIYANNITIGCNVQRIDAVLIANGTVDTCNIPGDKDGNARERSNQLVVNGAIIANNINLGRTFGAYTGIYTKIPAEIINYDASILLWAKSRSDTGNYSDLTAVYRHELAPRR